MENLSFFILIGDEKNKKYTQLCHFTSSLIYNATKSTCSLSYSIVSTVTIEKCISNYLFKNIKAMGGKSNVRWICGSETINLPHLSSTFQVSKK